MVIPFCTDGITNGPGPVLVFLGQVEGDAGYLAVDGLIIIRLGIGR